MTSSFPDRMIEPRDIAAAFAQLSRWPVPGGAEAAMERKAAAVWAWPLAGAALALIAGLAALVPWLIGAPAGITAAAALAVLALSTGALHEDGLADSADGLGPSGLTQERRLEIMHDSRIGAFGALALILAMLARWSGYAALDLAPLIGALVGAAALSRAVMALAAMVLPPARAKGQSAAIGQPDLPAVLTGLAFAFLIALVGCGWAAFAMLPLALLAALIVLIPANSRLGGQTGDVLGATQVLAEIGALAGAAAVLT
jgi:adenosylcobinamide-GDP ribazoletransferase